MGFSGQIVFGRSDGPLLDGAHEWPPRPGGWQTLQFAHDRWAVNTELLCRLVETSGAPACVALVRDSDVAEVVGLAPDGQEWRAMLNLDTAAELGIERPKTAGDDLAWIESPEYAEAVTEKCRELDAAAADGARGALAWAAAAGFGTNDQAAVEALLRSHEVFVEDLLDKLLDALGFPPPAAQGGVAEHCAEVTRV